MKLIDKIKCWLGLHDWHFDYKYQGLFSNKQKCSNCKRERTVTYLKL